MRRKNTLAGAATDHASTAGLLIHQLLHLEQVGKDAGWPVVNGHQTLYGLCPLPLLPLISRGFPQNADS